MQIIIKTIPKYNIDVEAFRLLPLRGFLYWKDRNGYYLGCNDLMMEKCKLVFYKDLLTKNDMDFEFEEKETYIQEDKQVIQSGKTMQFLGSATSSDWSTRFFTIKCPLLNLDGQLAGIWGYSAYIDENVKDINYYQQFQDCGVSLKTLPSIYSETKRKNGSNSNNSNIIAKRYALSKRERECLDCYLRGLTAKETAKAHGLSYRTVEEYFNNIKKKIGYRYKRDLLALCKQPI